MGRERRKRGKTEKEGREKDFKRERRGNEEKISRVKCREQYPITKFFQSNPKVSPRLASYYYLKKTRGIAV